MKGDNAVRLAVERHLKWEACYNVRDTGGYDTLDGREIRWGALVRADSLCQLEPSGIQALCDHGVRTVIDLRSASELALAPHPFADHANGVTYLNIPILDESDTEGAALLREARSTRELSAVMLERYPKQFASAIRGFARAREGGVLVHCQVGKDRTGLVVAMLLSLAGVDDLTIAEDYAESDLHLQPVFERLLQEVDREGRARLIAQWSCTEENMLLTLETLRLRYGGVADYLRAAGLSGMDVNWARLRMRS